MEVWTLAKAYAPRLAISNLKRNRQMFFPYFLASSLMAAMFFIITNTISSQSISNMSWGGTTLAVLMIGQWLMRVFIVAYMFYINSFLIKRRKKEFGLYAVLGLEKRHVSRIIFLESVMLNAASLLLALIFGLGFGRICFQALLRVTQLATGSAYVVAPQAIAETLAMFGFIFLLTTGYNIAQVYFSNPINLLKGEIKGEKKSRFTAVYAILGTITLALAYYLAVTIKDKAMALIFFWPAVLLVIIATYLLFTAGSDVALTLLSKSKTFYYKPRPFIAISSLKYRMKQNAAGLANICILSTMVLTTLTGCCGLYFGQENILLNRHTSDISAHVALPDDSTLPMQALTSVDAWLNENASAYGVTIKEGAIVPAIHLGTARHKDGLLDLSKDTLGNEMLYVSGYGEQDADGYVNIEVYLMTLDVYNGLIDGTETLGEKEILFLYNTKLSVSQSLLAGYTPVSTRPVPDNLMISTNMYSNQSALYLVAPTVSAQSELLAALSTSLTKDAYKAYLNINLEGHDDDCLRLASDMRVVFSDTVRSTMKDNGTNSYSYHFLDIYSDRIDGYSLFGGLIFLGAFFAVLFLINTVLIIYFKQISEGYEDRERFAILQKIGMDDLEVKRTINSQFLFIFFLPLVVAFIHILFCVPMMSVIMRAFALNDISITWTCALVTSICFAAVYTLVFRITSRTYYNLVKR